MKLAPLLLVALVAPPAGHELRITYPEGRALTFESSDWSTLEPIEVGASMNGQELPAEAAEQIASGFPAERKEGRVVSTVTTERAAEGRPVVVRRRYEVLARRVEKGGEERELESPLEGRTLRLRAGDDGEVEAELTDDGPEVDPRHLEGFRLEDTIAVALPDRPVSVGDTWELSEQDARVVLGQEGAPRLFPDDIEQDAFRELLAERAEVGAVVTFEAEEERGGLACARLLVESTLELALDEVGPEVFGSDAAEDGMRVTGSVELEMRLRGTVWLAIEAGRPVARESEMEGRLVLDMDIDRAGLALEVRVESKLEGGESATWTAAE